MAYCIDIINFNTIQIKVKISIANQKGGVGKSSISFLLINALLQIDKKVNYIDCDPQKTTDRWLKNHNLKFSDDPDFIIVDTPPNLLNQDSKQHLSDSDKILIVSTPSLTDVEVTKSSIPMFLDFSKDTRVVWNKVKSARFIDTKAIDSYEQILGAKACRQRISDRACYSRLSAEGWNALDQKSKAEFMILIAEILI